MVLRLWMLIGKLLRVTTSSTLTHHQCSNYSINIQLLHLIDRPLGSIKWVYTIGDTHCKIYWSKCSEMYCMNSCSESIHDSLLLACPGAQAQQDHGCPGAQPQPLRYAILHLQCHGHNTQEDHQYLRQVWVNVCIAMCNDINSTHLLDPQTHYQGSTLSSLYGVHRELHMMSWLVQEGPLKLGPNAIHQAPTCHAHHRAKHSPQTSLGSHQWASISAMCVHLFLGTSTSKNTAIQFHKIR